MHGKTYLKMSETAKYRPCSDRGTAKKRFTEPKAIHYLITLPNHPTANLSTFLSCGYFLSPSILSDAVRDTLRSCLCELLYIYYIKPKSNMKRSTPQIGLNTNTINTINNRCLRIIFADSISQQLL